MLPIFFDFHMVSGEIGDASLKKLLRSKLKNTEDHCTNKFPNEAEG